MPRPTVPTFPRSEKPDPHRTIRPDRVDQQNRISISYRPRNPYSSAETRPAFLGAFGLSDRTVTGQTRIRRRRLRSREVIRSLPGGIGSATVPEVRTLPPKPMGNPSPGLLSGACSLAILRLRAGETLQGRGGCAMMASAPKTASKLLRRRVARAGVMPAVMVSGEDGTHFRGCHTTGVTLGETPSVACSFAAWSGGLRQRVALQLLPNEVLRHVVSIRRGMPKDDSTPAVRRFGTGPASPAFKVPQMPHEDVFRLGFDCWGDTPVGRRSLGRTAAGAARGDDNGVRREPHYRDGRVSQ